MVASLNPLESRQTLFAAALLDLTLPVNATLADDSAAGEAQEIGLSSAGTVSNRPDHSGSSNGGWSERRDRRHPEAERAASGTYRRTARGCAGG
ncbi:hypothetical protein [Microvirga rosea]|uniref:hypothetical protein n=1 Tax=Microvirga rosea TaxID=2715425 RepID=UPI001D09DDCA|nr:hypothetical protein [Microvirga rosea]MCB8819422.1 hypothetical protein [Microvirga rosea]